MVDIFIAFEADLAYLVRDRVTWSATIQEFISNELWSLDMLILRLLLDMIGEEEGSQDREHDEELEQND